MPQTIPQPVLEVLDTATIAGNLLTLPDRLDRKLYSQTNKILEALGGRWDRRAGGHVFDADAASVIEPVILTGEYANTRQEFGQFDSPPDVVRSVIAAAGIENDMSVLEPSAGIGNLALAAEEAGAIVAAIEIDPKRAATANDRLFGGCRTGDFLAENPDAHPRGDRVVMNPPFARQEDIDHVYHAARFLKPGGRLVAVMSAGVTFRSNRKTEEFRRFIEIRNGSIEPLPLGCFKPSGTSVNACLVSFDV